MTVNGKEYAAQSPEKKVVSWTNIPLQDGANGVVVQAIQNGTTYTDEVTWMYESPYNRVNLIIKTFDWLPDAWYWIGGGFLLSLLTWFFGIRNSKNRPTWRKVLVWIIFLILILVTLAMFAVNTYLSGALEG